MEEYINRERARFEAKRYFKNMDEIQEDLDMLFCMLPAENVAPVQEWISVKDRLPEDQEEVLVCTRSKNGIRNIDKGYMAIDHFIHRGRAEVTHWMLMPNPPKGE